MDIDFPTYRPHKSQEIPFFKTCREGIMGPQVKRLVAFSHRLGVCLHPSFVSHSFMKRNEKFYVLFTHRLVICKIAQLLYV